MEWFRDDGCLTDEGLRALTAGQLDELGRLETAEHLSYCDACMDRYTALLTADALETPPRSMRGTVMSTILPPAQSQDAEPEPQKPEPLGKPVETRADRESAGKLPRPLQKLLDGVTSSPRTTPNT